MSISELYEIFLEYPQVCTDTRKIISESLFFALRGEHFNANAFAGQALAAGCRFAIMDDRKYYQPQNKQMIFVDNVLKTLQELAAFHRKKLGTKIIAVTGTNGKTTTKELLAAVLSAGYNTFCTRGNLNNHIGVPLTLLSLTNSNQFGIIEMGANHPGEIDALCHIAMPDAGLITNIGKAHLEGFGSYEGIIQAKTELYRFIKEQQGIIFYNGDDQLLTDQLRRAGLQGIAYGTQSSFFYYGKPEETDPLLSLTVNTQDGREVMVRTNLFGRYNFYNVMAALCAGRYFGLMEDVMIRAVENYYPLNNRSQIKKTGHNTLILDLYNANPSSMEAALKSFLEWKSPGRLAILGEMLELGNACNPEHQKIVDFLQQHRLPAWLVGRSFYGLAQDSVFICHFKDTEHLVTWLKEHPVKDLNILIKGSRGNKLEQIVDLL